jgi:class 3 adenylate cyclase
LSEEKAATAAAAAAAHTQPLTAAEEVATPRRKRPALADLQNLLQEALPAEDDAAVPPPPPAEGETPPEPRPRRSRFDLLNDLAAPSTPTLPDANQPPTKDEIQAPPRTRRKSFDLLNDLSSPGTPAPPTPPASDDLDSLLPARRSRPAAPTRTGSALDALVAEQKADDAANALQVPAELRPYLPDDLWRRLHVAQPPRGVLINALERVRSVQYLLSTFLPRTLVQEKMRQPFPGRVKGQTQSGTLLFSDVSGFTALSEKLAGLGPEGAELLTARMNAYFAVMLDILAEADGVLLKFAGDALLAHFPADEADTQARHAGRALRAAQRMLQAMRGFAQIETPNGAVRLKMKIGLASGDFLAASVGTEQRMEYIVIGSAISDTMAAEGYTTAGGQIVLNPACAQALPEPRPALKRLRSGFFLLEPAATSEAEQADFELHTETRRMRGGIPLDAAPHAIVAEMQLLGKKIEALRPYLAPELAELVLSPANKRGIPSQFRPTTVMFCNFSGPETLLALWGEAGVQRVTSLLNAYFSAMNEVITRYGGIVSRIDPYSQGSKLLAMFGAPVAHEDDSQRAVSAALAMNVELEALNDGWQRKFARHLPDDWHAALIQHRIGISFGHTFAGQVGSSVRREYTLMGDEVNLAARLMSAAEMGRVLLDPAAADLVQDYFLLTPRPPMRMKGKSRPIPTFQVEGVQEDPLLRRIHNRQRLVGRGSQLAAVGSALSRAESGRGSALVIQGRAGVGKSHLADELLRRAEKRGFTLYTQVCSAYNSQTPFAAWAPLLRKLAGITTLDYAPETQQARFRQLLDRLQTPAAQAPLLAGLAGLERRAFESARPPAAAGDDDDLLAAILTSRRRGSQLEMLEQFNRTGAQTGQPSGEQFSQRERRQLFEAVTTALHTLVQQQPAVLFFEDAHWLDPESLALLAHLHTHLRQARLLIVLARRAEGLSDAGQIGTILTLQPLESAETQALVAHLLVTELAQVIHEQTAGNPSQVVEVTRWFMHTHQIDPSELKSVLQTSDFMQKLVLSQIEDLPEAQRQVIRSAAVIGAEFHTSEVQGLVGETLDRVTLSQYLRQLENQQLLRVLNAGADPRYIFQHSLVRDILYNSLPYEQRRSLHTRLADYLSTANTYRRRAQARLSALMDDAPAQAQNDSSSEVIAYHYQQAQAWYPAAQHWMTAAQTARHNGQNRNARQAYRQAVQALDHIPAEHAGQADAVAELRRQALTGQGDLALLENDFLSALGAYEAAFAGLPEIDQAPQPDGTPPAADERTQLARRLALVLPTQRRAAEALTLLQNLAAGPQAANDPAIAAELAWLNWRAGRREAQTWAERGLALLAGQAEDCSRGLHALLTEFSGDWELALVDYVQCGCNALAGLTLLRQGLQVNAGQDEAASLQFLQQVARQWQDLAEGRQPLALAYYYQAEQLLYRQHDSEAALAALEQAQAALAAAPPSLRANGHAVLPPARKLLEKQRRAAQSRTTSRRRPIPPWPVWDWQPYDDEVRIALLFNA